MLRIWTCQLQSYPSSYHPHGMRNRCLFLSDRNIYLRVYLRTVFPNHLQIQFGPLSQPAQLSHRPSLPRDRNVEKRRSHVSPALISEFRLRFRNLRRRRFRLGTPVATTIRVNTRVHHGTKVYLCFSKSTPIVPPIFRLLRRTVSRPQNVSSPSLYSPG